MIFIKIGTNCIIKKNKIHYALIKRKAQEIELLSDAVLVVSGAIGLGKLSEGEKRSNDALSGVALFYCFFKVF